MKFVARPASTYARSMGRFVLVALLAVAACGDGGETVEPLADGPSEAQDPDVVPYDVTVMTPNGTVAIHYAAYKSLGGFCPAGFYAYFYETNLLSTEPVLLTRLPFVDNSLTPPPTGTPIMGEASLSGRSVGMTDQVIFELTAAEFGSEAAGTPGHFAGTGHVDSGGWRFDITFDARPDTTTCL